MNFNNFFNCLEKDKSVKIYQASGTVYLTLDGNIYLRKFCSGGKNKRELTILDIWRHFKGKYTDNKDETITLLIIGYEKDSTWIPFPTSASKPLTIKCTPDSIQVFWQITGETSKFYPCDYLISRLVE